MQNVNQLLANESDASTMDISSDMLSTSKLVMFTYGCSRSEASVVAHTSPRKGLQFSKIEGEFLCGWNVLKSKGSEPFGCSCSNTKDS